MDEETFARIRLAARVAGVPEGEVVARAVAAFVADDGPAVDRWQPVPVYGVYRGHRVDGVFTPATHRLVVTSEPLAQRSFKSPSGAARAVIAALNPDRAVPSVSGWSFWRVAASDDRIAIFRRR